MAHPSAPPDPATPTPPYAERIPFRVDVDDRDAKLGKKIREAEKE